MKKYLMTGVAALALCAGFTACSNDEDFSFNENEYVEAQKALIEAKYQQAFVNAFGQPAKNHTWGFGNATTRTADPRGNMWASEGWNVPPVITDAQKNIVRQYFQQNTPIGYNDPKWKDFWIQQVYKGGTNTKDSKTTEEYTIGNGDAVVGGNHMDHLCSKDANGNEDHINDFNNSDNNDWEGRMLMRNSSTYSFGYINSNASAIHYDKAALVNWRVIAQWAVDKGLESSVESSVLNDGWNRSYMGFDWEQALPDDCYIPIYDYNAGWSADLPGGFPILGYQTFEFEGKTYRFLSANSNQYAYDQTETTFGGKKNYNDKPSDDIIRQLLSLGYLPYSDTQKDWIKLSTGADGYYSDWIVTLTEAKADVEPDEIKVRILCEDMNAGTEKGDFDFNDAVVDLTLDGEDVDNANVTKIEILHTGAQFDIYVDGHEVHAALGLDPGQFGSGHAEFTPSANNLKAADIKIVTHRDFTYTNDKGEKVTVKEELELGAPRGKAPAKILVGVDCAAPDERQAIDAKYTSFPTWVQSSEQNRVPFWRNNNDD